MLLIIRLSPYVFIYVYIYVIVQSLSYVQVCVCVCIYIYMTYDRYIKSYIYRYMTAMLTFK